MVNQSVLRTFGISSVLMSFAVSTMASVKPDPALPDCGNGFKSIAGALEATPSRSYGVARAFPTRIPQPGDEARHFWTAAGEANGFRTGVLLKPADYTEIKTAALRVLEGCGADCTVVGIGRSPAPLTAFIDNYEAGRALNLPLASFRHHPNPAARFAYPYDQPGIAENFKPLSPADEAILFRHFDEYLIKRLRPGQKSILLLDISEGGASLFSSELYIRKYLHDRKIDLEVRSFAFIEARFRRQFKELAGDFGVAAKFGALPPDSHLISTFNTTEYGDTLKTQFAQYKLGTQPHENGLSHDIFMNAMRTHMFLDSSLNAPLSALPLPPPGFEADAATRTFRKIGDPSVTAAILP